MTSLTPYPQNADTVLFEIQSYQPGQIKINHRIYCHSLIITPSELIEPWGAKSLELMTKDMFLPPLKIKPDVLLLGTGNEGLFPPIELYGHLINQGIGVEVMNTHAACRTYTLLTADGRNVAAALMIG